MKFRFQLLLITLFIHKDSEIFDRREGEEDDGVAVKAAKSGALTAGMGLLSRHSFLSPLPSLFRLLSGNNVYGSNPVTV